MASALIQTLGVSCNAMSALLARARLGSLGEYAAVIISSRSDTSNSSPLGLSSFWAAASMDVAAAAIVKFGAVEVEACWAFGFWRVCLGEAERQQQKLATVQGADRHGSRQFEVSFFC